MVLTSSPSPRPPGKISVFLPSFNKGGWVVDAMRSVLDQSRTDWELWILENSNDDGRTRHYIDSELRGYGPDVRRKISYELLEGEDIERIRREKYIPAWLLNVYYPEAAGDYIFYLSDDDVIDPECFEVMAGELDANPEYGIVYAGLRVYTPSGYGDIGPAPDAGIPALDVKTFPGSVDCRVDGGQIMHRKSCLDALTYPYFEEMAEREVARHADGIFLERLVGRFMFWPIDRYLITHRYTPESLWTNEKE